MAKVLRGKYKGKIVRINQFANDWITVQGTSTIFSPLSLEFNKREIEVLNNHTKNVGMFWARYEWNPSNPSRLRRKDRPLKGALENTMFDDSGRNGRYLD